MKRSINVSDFIVVFGVGLASIFFVKYLNAIEGIGGSIIFIPVIPFLILLSFAIKPITPHINYFVLTLVGVLILNYFAYLEMAGIKLDINYQLIYIFCVIATLLFYMKSVLSLVKPIDIFENFNKDIGSKLAIILFSPLFISVGFIVVIMVNAKPSLFSKYNKVLNYSNLNFTFIILGLLISLIYLLKISDSDIKKILIDEKDQIQKYSLDKFRKLFKLSLVFIISFGSLIEINRGLWLLWIETVLIISLMSIILWKFYRNIF